MRSRPPQGFKYDVIAAYGNKINSTGDTFGYNNAFSCYFPIDDSPVHGLLYINHDAPDQQTHGDKADGHYSTSQLQRLLYNQGASIVEVYRDPMGVWTIDTGSAYARRITGLTPMELTGPARGTGSVRTAGTVQGTVANRSGVQTPWGTVLSGEGLYDDTCRDAGLNPAHYGWVIEVDPLALNSRVRKHTALGRFRHSGLAMALGNNNRLVVYMGDGSDSACLYKFVSKNSYQPGMGKGATEPLNEGTLYAADLENGNWIALSTQAVQKALRDHGFQPPAVLQRSKESLLELFQEDGDVYVHAYEAAMILGATRTDRIGDVNLHPASGAVYINVGSSPQHGNVHGYVAVLTEQNNDAEAGSFGYDIFTSGGPQSGFSSPGSGSFEGNGNLWLASEIPADKLNQGTATALKNNGLYMLSTSSQTVNTAVQFASAPAGAHFAAHSLSPDGRTMFVSLQRAGSAGPWPALVAVTGFVQ
ncbi:PhoX family protein [Paenibacillus sp. P25]|nr:PhoX family protein [Paenibacillus sp. P25]